MFPFFMGPALEMHTAYRAGHLGQRMVHLNHGTRPPCRSEQRIIEEAAKEAACIAIAQTFYLHQSGKRGGVE